MISHLDEFTLLLFSASELDVQEERSTAEHLADCLPCRGALRGLETLDSDLRGLAAAGHLEQELLPSPFLPGDPFRRRPAAVGRKARPIGNQAVAASDLGLARCGEFLDAVLSAEHPKQLIDDVWARDPEHRFTLYYALQESGRRIAEGPLKTLAFAKAVLQCKRPAVLDEALRNAESALPWATIEGHAHVVAAQAALWQKSFTECHAHLVSAYAAFARGGDETSFAIVELTESQRRSFVGEGNAALALARRARATSLERGLDDQWARCAVAEGLAWVSLGEFEKAVPLYREALPVFERYALWSNYVGAVNSLATALYKLGRLDEARREFARVFRRFSRVTHRSWLGYVQQGLGDILLAAGRFRDAAISFGRASRYYADCDLRAGSLLSALAEAESWAKHGSSTRAKERLQLVSLSVQDDRSLDPSVRRAIMEMLRAAWSDSELISTLRAEVQNLLGPSSA